MRTLKTYELAITDDYEGGVWTKGHHTDEAFTEALANDWDYEPYGTIEREYWRVGFNGTEEKCYYPAKQGQRGAFPVTACHTVRWIRPKPVDDWVERILVAEVLES